MDSNNDRNHKLHGAGLRLHTTDHGYNPSGSLHNPYASSLSDCWTWRPLSQLYGPRRLKSTTEIKGFIAQECSGSDRYYCGFSLLIFNITSADNSEAIDIAHVFPLERIRLTDFIGHFPENRLILILPRTNRMGARRLAAELVKLAFARNIQLAHEAYSYPCDLDVINEALQEYMPKLTPIIPDEPGDGFNPILIDQRQRDNQTVPTPIFKKALNVILSSIISVSIVPLIGMASALSKPFMPSLAKQSQMPINHKGGSL